MKFFLEQGKKYLTAYDFYANSALSKNSLNGLTKEKGHFDELVKESKLFIVRNELVELFLNEIKKDASSKIIPLDEENEAPQPILRLPFNKIWIEPFLEMKKFIYPQLDLTWLGSLVEDIDSDFFYVTTMVAFKNQIGLTQVQGIPIKIHKYTRHTITINGKPEVIGEAGVVNDIIESLAKNLDLGYTQEDLLEITEKRILTIGHTTNPLLGIECFMTCHFSLITWIIQYINSANSEIEYIGISEKGYRSQIEKNKIPVPPAHIIRLKNKIIHTGFIFNGKKFLPNYCFDIRGHYRTLKHERYVKMHGKTIWINPFKKGRGKFIKKHYLVSRSDLWNQLKGVSV